MKIAVDTNILVRAAVRDDPHQCQLAAATLTEATTVFVSTLVLCEYVWVLARGYNFSPQVIIASIQRLINASNVVVEHRATVDAGLDQLAAGGDFADGVIAFLGGLAEAEEFVTLDVKAGAIFKAQGLKVRVLS